MSNLRGEQEGEVNSAHQQPEEYDVSEEHMRTSDEDDNEQKQEDEVERIPSPTTRSNMFISSSMASNYADDDTDVVESRRLPKKLNIIAVPTIIIEHCTNEEYNHILDVIARTLKIELQHVIEVKINPELPNRNYNGWFQIRTEDGEILVDYGEDKSYVDVLLFEPYMFVLHLLRRFY